MAIVGNVSVGKTSIFDSLCRHSEHSVNIPGSTVEVTRGVMAVGRFGAPRKLQSYRVAEPEGALALSSLALFLNTEH